MWPARPGVTPGTWGRGPPGTPLCVAREFMRARTWRIAISCSSARIAGSCSPPSWKAQPGLADRPCSCEEITSTTSRHRRPSAAARASGLKLVRKTCVISPLVVGPFSEGGDGEPLGQAGVDEDADPSSRSEQVECPTRTGVLSPQSGWAARVPDGNDANVHGASVTRWTVRGRERGSQLLQTAHPD